MSALAATDVTVTLDRANVSIPNGGKKRIAVGTITFGDGALTYPTGGIPLPDKGKFGMYRSLDSLGIVGVNGLTTDYDYKYDKTNYKLQLFGDSGGTAGALAEAANSATPAARTLRFVAIGW